MAAKKTFRARSEGPKGAPTVTATSLKDNPAAPEIFVDGYSGMSYRQGVVKFNFFSSRITADLKGSEQVVTCRLVMSVPVLASIHEAFGRALNDMERDGLISRVPPEKQDG